MGRGFNVRKPARLLVACLVTALIVVSGVEADVHRSASAAGFMTPALGANPQFQTEGAVDPSAQPGKLRSCQKTGLCYGPDQIRAAYGFQALLDQGVDGSG